MLEIPGVERAKFKARLNRFLVELEDGRLAHLHDPGRLRELLVPGREIIVRKVEGRKRKTDLDVLAVRYRNYWVFVHSGYHSRIAEKLIPTLFGPIRAREVKLGNSRVDFLLEDGRPLEVKGCTLRKGGVALFPDAPTKRGARHVSELIQFMTNGSKAAILFLIFRAEARCFYANKEIDQEFADIFEQAYKRGVQIIPLQFYYDAKEEWLYYKGKLPLCKK